MTQVCPKPLIIWPENKVLDGNLQKGLIQQVKNWGIKFGQRIIREPKFHINYCGRNKSEIKPKVCLLNTIISRWRIWNTLPYKLMIDMPSKYKRANMVSENIFYFIFYFYE